MCPTTSRTSVARRPVSHCDRMRSDSTWPSDSGRGMCDTIAAPSLAVGSGRCRGRWGDQLGPVSQVRAEVGH